MARGARQLVVQEAFDTMFWDGSYVSWLTPITNIGASPDGAEMTTFLAPPFKCLFAYGHNTGIRQQHMCMHFCWIQAL